MESLRRLGCSASQLGQISFPPPRPKCKAQNQPFPLSISPLSLSRIDLWVSLCLVNSMDLRPAAAPAPARLGCARRIASGLSCSAAARPQWGGPVSSGGRRAAEWPDGVATSERQRASAAGVCAGGTAASRHGGRAWSAGAGAQRPSGQSHQRPKQALQVCSTASQHAQRKGGSQIGAVT